MSILSTCIWLVIILILPSRHTLYVQFKRLYVQLKQKTKFYWSLHYIRMKYLIISHCQQYSCLMTSMIFIPKRLIFIKVTDRNCIWWFRTRTSIPRMFQANDFLSTEVEVSNQSWLVLVKVPGFRLNGHEVYRQTN